MRVAIIGAGPSGLISAKEALSKGFEVVIFEKKEKLGGLWLDFVWDSMKTNISKFTCSFSDFPWPKDSSTFPSSKEMYEYICEYACHNDLIRLVRFNTEIKEVKKTDADKYSIKTKDSEGEDEIFDSVFICSGIFSEPYIPTIDGLDSFEGDILHSKDYKKPEDYIGKKILIVGNSFSGSEIASELSDVATVYHSFTNPYWMLQRYLTVETYSGPSKRPIDLVFYNKKPISTDSPEEQNLKKNKYFSTICKEQQGIDLLRVSDDRFIQPPMVAINDKYLKKIQEGKIHIISSKLRKIDGKLIEFEKSDEFNDDELAFDFIIFSTGYSLNLDFLSDEIKEKIKYDKSDQMQPIILYDATIHSELKNMYFILFPEYNLANNLYFL